jgi:hypothetical protein
MFESKCGKLACDSTLVMSREVREKSASFYNNYNLLGLDIFMDTSFRYGRIQLSVTFGYS